MTDDLGLKRQGSADPLANRAHRADAPRVVYELWPEVGQMLGLTRNATYAAAKRGDIPVIRIGKLIRVPKAAFDRMLVEAGARDQ